MIKNIINYFSASSFIFVLGVLLLPIYTRFLTPYDYGILALYIAFGQIFTNIISLGFDSANFRYFFKDKSIQNDFKITNSTNLIILFSLLIFGLIITYISLDFFEEYIFRGKIPKEIIIISYIFNSLFKIYQYFFRLLVAQERSFLFSIFQILYFSIGNSISLILIIFYSYDYKGKIYGDLVSVIICIILIVYFQKKYLGLFFSKDKAIRSINFALPLTPNKIIGSINSNADKYIISYFKNLSDLGTYELAHRLSNLNRLFVDNVTRAWQPYFFNNINDKYLIVKNYNKIIIFLSIFYLSFILLSEEIIYILTTPDFYKAAYFMPFIIYSMFISLTSSALYLSQIMYSEKTKYIIPTSLVEIAFNISLNLILVPIYGVFGSVISLLISSILSSLFGIYYGQKVCILPIKFSKFYLIFTFLFIATFLQYYSLSVEINIFLKLLIKVLVIITYTCFLTFIKFIEINDFVYIIKNIRNFLERK